MSIDFEALEREQSRLNSSQQDWRKKYVKMPEGEGFLIVRFLPGGDGKNWTNASRVHKICGKNYHSYLEFDRNGKLQGNCPIASELKKLWSEIERLDRTGKKDAAQELRGIASQIRAKEKHYFNVIVRSERQEDNTLLTNVGPKILSIGKELYAIIINNMLGNAALDMPKLGDITDFLTGRDFRIVQKIKKGSGNQPGYPDYNLSKFLDPSPAGTQEEWKNWLANRHNLAEERRLKPKEELQDALDVFFGRKPDPDTQAFSPSVNSSAVAAPPVQKPSIREVIVPDVVDDDSPVDDEWLAELRKT